MKRRLKDSSRNFTTPRYSAYTYATITSTATSFLSGVVAKNPITTHSSSMRGGEGLTVVANDSAAAAAAVISTKFDVDDSANGELNLWVSVCIGSLLALLIICTVVGNFFVILAILLERDLRSRPQYYLIFSLAVADLIVGVVVTPLGAWSTVKQGWDLGVTLCDFWISVDVLVCTASILHLVAIALDRYWSVTSIYYTQNRTPKRIFVMLLVIWVVSLLISVAPMFGWKDAQFVERVRKQHVCLISQQISYQVFSTATAFYVPLCAIIIVYYQIWRAAKKRFKRERDRRTISRCLDESIKAKVVRQISTLPTAAPAAAMAAILTPPTPVDDDDDSPDASPNQVVTCGLVGPTENGHYGQHAALVAVKFACQPERNTTTNNNSTSDDERTPMQLSENPTTTMNVETPFNNAAGGNKSAGNGKNKALVASAAKRLSIKTDPVSAAKKKRRRMKESIENKRERKAWRTLAIITGTFVACWTPFFLVSLYRPICNCRVPPVLESVTAWLGYLNSALNPIIYTVFSMDFRMAFQRILKRLCMVKEF